VDSQRISSSIEISKGRLGVIGIRSAKIVSNGQDKGEVVGSRIADVETITHHCSDSGSVVINDNIVVESRVGRALLSTSSGFIGKG